MQVKCKKCKTDLTTEYLKMLENKISKVVCPCELRDKIAKEFGLFDKWMNKLVTKNGVTEL